VRRQLIPAELLKRPELRVEIAAAGLCVPVEEVRAAHAEVNANAMKPASDHATKPPASSADPRGSQVARHRE
jgi:hypothetical protein